MLTSPGFLDRHSTRFPDTTLLYSVYVWTSLFHYALQGLWVLTAFVVALGGLAREKATEMALFTLGLPIRRRRLFLIRALVAWAESIAFGLASAILIPVISAFVGESYPFLQALAFGASMTAAGLVVIAFGLRGNVSRVPGAYASRLERLRCDERHSIDRSENPVNEMVRRLISS